MHILRLFLLTLVFILFSSCCLTSLMPGSSFFEQINPTAVMNTVQAAATQQVEDPSPTEMPQNKSRQLTPTKKATTQPTPGLNQTAVNPNAPQTLPAEMGGSIEPDKPFLPLVKTYTDPKNLYLVKYPAGWQLFETGGWREICLDNEKAVCFAVQIDDYPKDGSLGTFLKDTYENFKGAVSDFHLIDRQETYVGGYPAYIFENSYTFHGEYNQGFSAYLISYEKHAGYEIQALIKNQMQDYDLYYETLRQMIYSFLIVN
jgi:hypothetical protein